MRLGNVFAGRPLYYDRTPTILCYTYSGDVAPHVATVRWTYTVPAGAKAYIESLYLRMMRVAVAAPVSNYGVSVAVTDNLAVVAVIAAGYSNDNTLYYQQIHQLSQAALLVEGNVIAASTFDQSTGGTMQFRANAKICQFDA